MLCMYVKHRQYADNLTGTHIFLHKIHRRPYRDRKRMRQSFEKQIKTVHWLDKLGMTPQDSRASMRINKLGKTSITGRCVEKRTKKDKEINTERPRHMALPVKEHDLIRDWQSCEMVNHNGLRIGMARKDSVKSSVMYYTYKYLNSAIYCLQTCSVMY